MPPERLNPDQEIPLTGRKVQDFWAWGFSDILTNISRAVFAEWLVGTALDAVAGIRPVWEYYDLDYSGKKIEVKSTSYLQNWKRSSNSRGNFDIKATTADFPVDPSVPPGPDREYYTDSEKKRRADVYVFGSYPQEDPALVDLLNVPDWRFYVLSTWELEQHFGSQKTVALSRIQAVTKAVDYEGLRARVDDAIEQS
jgi:hypothetical protein